MTRVIESQDFAGLEIRRYKHGIPTRVDRLIYVRGRTLESRRIHLLLCRRKQRLYFFRRKPHPLDDVFNRSPHIQHILRGIVVHLADFIDIETKSGCG